MVPINFIRRSTPADFKLTKLFGMDDFSVSKDSGKVLIITIYCFYNYNSRSYFSFEAVVTRQKTREMLNFRR